MLRLAAVLLSLCVAFSQSGVTPATCPASIKSIKKCPPAGCGGISDAFLNQAKNRTDVPESGIQDLNVSDIKQIEQPSSWKTGKARDSITGDGREGTAVRVIAVLQVARKESGETCNCELTKVADTDVHLVLLESSGDQEDTSITAELTPRLRAKGHSNWKASAVQKKLKDSKTRLIRVTGWLMLDTAHLPHPDLLPDESGHSQLTRATNWEVHPVTRLEFCTGTATECKAGTGWEEF